LRANGWPASTRCVIASSLGSADERIVPCELAQLAAMALQPSPALMLFFPL
jgi:hypothetical protein